MKAEKFANSTATNSSNQLHESQEQMFRLRFQMAMGQTDGLKKYRGLKKDRARMLTILRAARRLGRDRDAEAEGRVSMARHNDSSRVTRTKRSAKWSRPRWPRPSWLR